MEGELYDRQIRALGTQFNDRVQSLEVRVFGGGELLLKKEICKHLILMGISRLYCDIQLQKYFSRTSVLQESGESKLESPVLNIVFEIANPNQTEIQIIRKGDCITISLGASNSALDQIVSANIFMFWLKQSLLTPIDSKMAVSFDEEGCPRILSS